MVYIRWSAWTSDIFQRFSSSWSSQSCLHDPTSGISRCPCLSHSLICILFRTCEIDEYWLSIMPFHVLYRSLLQKKSHAGKLHCLLNIIYCTELVHIMETVRIFQRLLLTIIVMMIILIEFAVAISMNSWIFLMILLEVCVYLN